MPPTGLSPTQHALLDALRAGNARRHPAWKRTRYEFILEYGWWYEPSPLPEGIEANPPGQCFMNAFNLALDDDSLIYCEGVVLPLGGSIPVHHAWATDGTGRVIDSTVESLAGAYAGVPFNTMFLNHYHLRNREVVSLLDDYLHDWPMLCELGDRPREWLGHKGKGVAPLSGGEARRKQ